ncbi:hypothetical protein M0R45_020210 [Rubus argutus]|uniref:Uncharacterized protein n=1 Tax=Rubus argutus TaxID=59490 RepID=A0AAW1X9D8_RUBAR
MLTPSSLCSKPSSSAHTTPPAPSCCPHPRRRRTTTGPCLLPPPEPISLTLLAASSSQSPSILIPVRVSPLLCRHRHPQLPQHQLLLQSTNPLCSNRSTPIITTSPPKLLLPVPSSSSPSSQAAHCRLLCRPRSPPLHGLARFH